MSTLIAEGYFGGVAQKVHCRKIGCEECAPIVRAQLVARGCRGKPNRHIVWTSRVRADQTPDQACVDLKKAMARTYLHIKRELKKPHEVRWKLHNNNRDLKVELKVRRYVREDEEAGLTDIAYLWTTEATEQGWPHLHMLFRGPFIPQDWLSEQMGMLLDSPNVWINRIYDVAKKAGYIAGYVAKETNRFGKGNRYFATRNYELPSDTPWQRDTDPSWSHVCVKRVVDLVRAAWTSWGREVREIKPGRIAWGDPYDPLRPDADAPTKLLIASAINQESARDGP